MTFDRYLTVEGGVYFDICYLTDNNVIRSTQSSFDFSQEIANDEISENSVIQSDLQEIPVNISGMIFIK